MLKLILSILVLSTFSIAANASDFVVVFNNGKKVIEKKLSKEEVKSLYLGYQTYINGEKVHLTFLEGENKGNQEFLRNIVGMSAREFTAYWRRKLFSGKGVPPKTFKETSDLINFLKRNESSIGILPTKFENSEQLLVIPGDDLVTSPSQSFNIAIK